MPQFKHKYNGNVVTANGRVAKSLDANPKYERIASADGPFDPGKHGVQQVLAHLADADEAEKARVIAAEVAGKNRPTIVQPTS